MRISLLLLGSLFVVGTAFADEDCKTPGRWAQLECKGSSDVSKVVLEISLKSGCDEWFRVLVWSDKITTAEGESGGRHVLGRVLSTSTFQQFAKFTRYYASSGEKHRGGERTAAILSFDHSVNFYAPESPDRKTLEVKGRITIDDENVGVTTAPLTCHFSFPTPPAKLPAPY